MGSHFMSSHPEFAMADGVDTLMTEAINDSAEQASPDSALQHMDGTVALRSTSLGVTSINSQDNQLHLDNNINADSMIMEDDFRLQQSTRFSQVRSQYPNLSSLEVLLTIYTPILESLSNNLNTREKIKLTHVSPHLRRLCHGYPSFWAHPDFHLEVNEGDRYDSYGIGKVYNLDALLSVLPLEGRLVSLNVDWTAITGHYLFKIVDKCQATLQHLSVRGCRKVSIKHHIVPHFVHQYLIEPYSIASKPELAGTTSGSWKRHREKPYRALKCLHAWKARGVRRKPFLIDRKEADGDEPTRFLTTLASALGIFVDVGLCSTPKLRCPRRREITRRGREKFCVPFDRRWRETNSQIINLVPSLVANGTSRDVKCAQCNEDVGERCEACAVAMHCSSCAKTLCHSCSWTAPFSFSNSSSGSSTASLQSTAVNSPASNGYIHSTVDLENDIDPIAAGLYATIRPCCVDTLPLNPIISSRYGDMYCEECFDNLTWGKCDACSRSLCKQHEWPRRRTCSTGAGGCGRSFCFTAIGAPVVPNAQPPLACDMGVVRECVNCNESVCGDCRRRTGCCCRLCSVSFYCNKCWPSKPFSCESDLARRNAAAAAAAAAANLSNMDDNLIHGPGNVNVFWQTPAGGNPAIQPVGTPGPGTDLILLGPNGEIPPLLGPGQLIEVDDEMDEEDEEEDGEEDEEDDEEEDEEGADDEEDEEENAVDGPENQENHEEGAVNQTHQPMEGVSITPETQFSAGPQQFAHSMPMESSLQSPPLTPPSTQGAPITTDTSTYTITATTVTTSHPAHYTHASSSSSSATSVQPPPLPGIATDPAVLTAALARLIPASDHDVVILSDPAHAENISASVLSPASSSGESSQGRPESLIVRLPATITPQGNSQPQSPQHQNHPQLTLNTALAVQTPPPGMSGAQTPATAVGGDDDDGVDALMGESEPPRP